MTLASTTRRHCADPAGAAQQVAAAVAPLFRGPLPVGIRAWDGSAAGQRDAPAVVLNDPAALRRLLFRCGELGLAQAYVSGEIDVDGDLLEGLRAVWRSERAGLEVRDVHAPREHYVRTVEA
jgi:cyclopropane-fatty-acyl-phospholipid synthase